MITGNEPATGFSIPGDERLGWQPESVPGLTIRQYFAKDAMRAIIGDVEVSRWVQTDFRYTGTNFKEVVSINACEFADALIAELNKKEVENGK